MLLCSLLEANEGREVADVNNDIIKRSLLLNREIEGAYLHLSYNAYLQRLTGLAKIKQQNSGTLP